MAENGSPSTGRGAKDEQLALCLARGLTVATAASEAGVSERTAYRRLAETDFARRVEDLRCSLVEVAVRRLSDHMAAAADKVAALMGSANDAVALGAAKAVLDLGMKAHEQRCVIGRLEALERVERQGREQGW
jgi:hypothetical protein